jgi:predicted nucleic acid-binding protein
MLDAVPYLEANKDTWSAAGGLSAYLRRRGNTTPLSDLTIAALALEGGHEVFSLNGHFARVPELELYSPSS